MNIKTTTVAELRVLAKEHKIAKPSKLTKGELVDALTEIGVKFAELEVTPKKESKAKVNSKSDEKSDKLSPKPRLDPLNKKLEKYISIDEYKEKLATFKEDVDDAEIVKLITDKVNAFIESDDLTNEDYKKYVSKYKEDGFAQAAFEYMASEKSATLKKLSVEEMYKLLANFIYKNDNIIYANVVKKFKKHVVVLHKPKKTAAVKKPSGSKSKSKKKDEESEEESDSDDDKDDKDEEEEDEEEA